MQNAVAGAETVRNASVVSKLRHPSFIYAFLLAETSFRRIQHRNKLTNLRPVQFVSNVLTNRVCQTELALVVEIRTTIPPAEFQRKEMQCPS